jgi:hypothetical protein
LIKNTTILFCCILTLFGCVKEVPLDTQTYVDPKPVFHFLIRPDSILRADFSKVVPISEKSSTTDNGLVSVYRNGVLQGDMIAQGVGRYVLIGNSFKPRDSFLVYGSDGLFSFFVRGKVPSNILINGIDTQTLLVPGIGPAYTMDVEFKDSAIDENYYRIMVFRQFYEYKLDKNNQRIDSTLRSKRISIEGSELPFIQNNFNNYNSSEILFTDATFNGTTPKFRIYSTEKLHETAQFRTLKLDVVLENLEAPLYNFYNTRNAHIWQQQSISQLPGTVLGNITSGYGVSASYTQHRYTIVFK